MVWVCFQGKPFNIIVIQVYASTTNAEEAEVKWFNEEKSVFLTNGARTHGHPVAKKRKDES